MQIYNGEPILDALACRLVPPSNLYPDCDCLVVLTEGHCYVLEDNFDGSYETHFQIPMERIRSLERYRTEEGGPSASPDADAKDNRAPESVPAVLSIFTGIFSSGARKSPRPAKAKAYLRLRHETDDGITESIFFSDCVKDPGRIIKAWEKYRERWGV